MKKIYESPITNVVRIALQNQLLTVSGSDPELHGYSNGDYVEEGGIVLGSRRHNNVWDEDDEEEYNEYNY